MSGGAADFPGLYDVLITPLDTETYGPGRSYVINTSFEPYRRDAFRHRTIQAQRESISLTDEPGEGTVNVEGLWRRSQRSWHHGAGQLYADRDSSDPYRFYYSKGVDPWTQDQLGLLPDVTEQIVGTDGHTWVDTAVAGAYVYYLQMVSTTPGSGGNVQWTTDYVTWHTPTGLTGNVYHLSTNGGAIFATGDDGIWMTQAGAASWTLVNSNPFNWYISGFANGRFICTKGALVYDMTDYLDTSGAADTLPIPAPGTPTDPDWVWGSITDGEGYIYMSGYGRDQLGTPTRSAIYAFTLSTDGTNVLQAPILALPMEGGDIAGIVYNYLNYIFVGSTLGIRMCSINNANDPTGQQGQLTAGPVIPNAVQPMQPLFDPNLNSMVGGIVGQNRFVWFTWQSYDDSSTGLGRLDLATLLGPLQPAYASDLMVPAAQLNLHHLHWCPITNGPLMLSSYGLWTQKVDGSGNPVAVASGVVDSGRITFGIPDPKLLAQANYNSVTDGTILPDGYTAKTIGGTVTLQANVDGGSFFELTPLAPLTEGNPPVLLGTLDSGEDWRVQAILNSASSGTEWPFISRWTVKALPQVVSGVTISAVLSLYKVDEVGRQRVYTAPYDEYAWLENLRLAQAPFTYQEASALDGSVQYEAVGVITEIDWLPFKRRDRPDGGFEGDLVLYIKTIVG